MEVRIQQSEANRFSFGSRQAFPCHSYTHCCSLAHPAPTLPLSAVTFFCQYSLCPLIHWLTHSFFSFINQQLCAQSYFLFCEYNVVVDIQYLTGGVRVDPCIGVWCVGEMPYLPRPNSCLQFVKGSTSNASLSQSQSAMCNIWPIDWNTKQFGNTTLN